MDKLMIYLHRYVSIEWVRKQYFNPFYHEVISVVKAALFYFLLEEFFVRWSVQYNWFEAPQEEAVGWVVSVFDTIDMLQIWSATITEEEHILF